MKPQLDLFTHQPPAIITPTRVGNSHTNTTHRAKLENQYANQIEEKLTIGNLVSYQGNKQLPVLRLYRYKEAFSYPFVKQLFHEFGISPTDYVFDPFCGMGTALFTSCINGIPAIGIDKLPTSTFIANTLPKFLTIQSNEISKYYEEAKQQLEHTEEAHVAEDVRIMKIAFSPVNLTALKKWKTLIATLPIPYQDVMNLLYLSILEPASFTSKDGQFLRYLPDKLTLNPTILLANKVKEAEQDLVTLQQLKWHENYLLPAVFEGDARNLSPVPFSREPTLILTSPPYANRYDYTRSYSLELCFNFVYNFEALKQLRFSILRSHIEAKASPEDCSPHEAVTEILECLKPQQDRDKLNNERIPTMLLAYFVDMQKVIREWYRVCAKGATVVMVIDNVRFAGEHVPVDLILSDLAHREGFQVKKILVARYKGNSSQQMGKYGKFPVRESITIWQKN